MLGSVELINADVLAGLKGLEAGSVQCCVTSPPYWGLRDYGIEPTVWCDGWSGCLGLEPTPSLFVEHMVEVFREARRVLRDDGTLWLNLGDSYNANQGFGFDTNNDGGKRKRECATRRLDSGCKPKDLVGIPWTVALALRDDGWYLRSDIIWAKPNPMPESVRDRPTKSHEYIFLLTKSPRYYWDAEAVRERLQQSSVERGRYPHNSFAKGQFIGSPEDESHQNGKDVKLVADLQNPAGRNTRTVWTIPTQPYPEAHFATYPEELVRRCIAAGTSEKGCCPECGAPWERVVEKTYHAWSLNKTKRGDAGRDPATRDDQPETRGANSFETTGWRPTCCCGMLGTGDTDDNSRGLKPIPCTILDNFAGSGTTLRVARLMGRNSVGIEINPDYIELAKRRIYATPGNERPHVSLKGQRDLF